MGNATDYDGLCIGNIFVTADAGSLADEQAVLQSSNPENNGTDVSPNGSIILNFDKKIKAGTGKATLDGEEIAPIISGKSAVFKYSGLKYGTAYQVVSPAIAGYNPNTRVIAGTMPLRNVTMTVIYVPRNTAIIIDDLETPLGIGVGINVGESIE